MKNGSKTILVIGKVWPESKSSAAGSRMIQLLDYFHRSEWVIHFASASARGEYSDELDRYCKSKVQIRINDSSFDDLIHELRPDAVLFDRFMIEEQFGWRVAEHFPNALRIVDTIDLHCVRTAREKAVKGNRAFSTEDILKEEVAKREFASIMRSDLSLIISDEEMNIIGNLTEIEEKQLLYLPFLLSREQIDSAKESSLFEERNHFVTIGNFRHAPNRDSVKWLRSEIWPKIRKELPEAVIHVYGSYPAVKDYQLNSPENGFYVEGRAESAHQVIESAKVLLAPLRFGAGLKGKLLEAMLNGTPSVTTSIGAEGMVSEGRWGGFISDSAKDFSRKALILYQEKEIWNDARKTGFEILEKRFERDTFESILSERISEILNDLASHRSKPFMHSMIEYHSLRNSKFMSKWIEEKNSP